MIIAKYSAVEELDFYKNINNKFSRELMDTIVNKNKDWSFQYDFMKIAMKYKNYKTDDGDLIRESFKEFQDTIEKLGARI